MKLKHLFLLGLVAMATVKSVAADDKFPDGTVIPEWFRNISVPTLAEQGKAYVITDYGVVNDSTIIQTEKIQAVIDKAAQEGGGVIVVPEGTFLSGSLFFRQGTNLHLKKGATIKGSDDISNFPILKTRMEGQTLDYFAALINVDNVNGFKLTGEGTLDGNGLRYWKSFWLRRKVNPKCTNMEELRPRLVYVSNSNEVLIAGVKLKNSPFWTTHLYRSNYVKLLGLTITSPASPVKAPSTDAVDIDVCNNVLIKNCYMAVNDDAVALKGGKGPWADKDENNGENTISSSKTVTTGSATARLPVEARAFTTRTSSFVDARLTRQADCCGSRCVPILRKCMNTSRLRTLPAMLTTYLLCALGLSSST